jgi:hypothetical protein
MSQTEKAQYYKALKDAGVTFDKHYREYDTSELRAAYAKLTGSSDPLPPTEATQDESPVEDLPPVEFFGLEKSTPAEPAAPAPPPAASTAMAGQHLNTQAADQPLYTDEYGRQWFQEEILKPASPKPRARRVLTYLETGVQEKQVKVGDYIETFEVAGDGPARTAEVKITLPSYQVGIFKDPRFPFRVHTYNGLQGFDLFEVQEYYNGAELVPSDIKRVYVENVLCYDIRTTVRAIETEYRQMQLTGKIRD